MNFSLRTLLKEHKRKHKDGTLYECDTCGETFANKAKLSIHEKTHRKKIHRKYECTRCGESLETYYALKTHIEQVHKSLEFRV